MKKYVIIGNGVAAVGCIEGIRAADKEGSITVVSAENYPVYCRPLISYCLEGKASPDRMNYRPADFYETNGCEVLYGRKAVALDPQAHTVALDDGRELPYDALCIATGSSPFIPPMEGLESVEKKFPFLTMDDMLSLEQAITPDSRVLIVGAGLIGLKCAEGLRDRVAGITVCDLADRVLSSILDADCASIMQAHLEQNGLRFLLQDSVTRFAGNTAYFRSGAVETFDVLVLAVGVRANIALVKDAGGETGRGIAVDEQMHTSLPDVYAAGDCAEGLDSSCGQKRVLAILPNAYAQGRTAGRNMAIAGRNTAGEPAAQTDAIPMNAIGFFGLHALTAGSYFTPEQGGELYEERGEGTIRRLFTRDGYLTGFILIGDVARAGIYTALIREKRPLAELDFDLLKKSPTFLAFGKETRGHFFGGVIQ